MKRGFWLSLLLLLTALPLAGAANDEAFELIMRKRVRVSPEVDRFHQVLEQVEWNPQQTAIIVCDMWDLHHCLNAVRREKEMAPRMNEVLKAARARGATIIHAPSDCMEFYQDHPARQRAQQVPRAASMPEEIGSWCYRIPAEEQGEYPIDQSDGGEDDDPEEHRRWAEELAQMGRNPRAPWKRQIDVLEIDSQRDYISDKGEEVWSILEQKGIDNVILVGVHTNMCVLGRPFGLRQMARNGKNVVLMRDMTDTMYNPARPPFVSHFTGTDLIVEHIEKWVCPTITSDQLIGGKEFRFSLDKRPHLVMVVSEPEYRTEETLPKFAAENLGHDFRVSFVWGDAEDGNRLSGIELLDQADVMLLSVRRRALPAEQLAVVRRFIESGKPVVAIRTSNHAFSLRGQEPPAGHAVWEDFDAEVIGGNYTNHHGNGPIVEVSIAKESADHPILAGLSLENFRSNGSLYQVSPLASSATPLLIGQIPNQPAEPVAWTNTSKYGGRVFYTSLGHVEDFSQKPYQQLLRNALLWSVGRAE